MILKDRIIELSFQILIQLAVVNWMAYGICQDYNQCVVMVPCHTLFQVFSSLVMTMYGRTYPWPWEKGDCWPIWAPDLVLHFSCSNEASPQPQTKEVKEPTPPEREGGGGGGTPFLLQRNEDEGTLYILDRIVGLPLRSTE